MRIASGTQINIATDPEFVDYMPELSRESLDELFASLKAEGCRDSLVVWENDGVYTLLDGHHRFGLCQANGIPYNVIVMGTDDIPDKTAAIQWMIRNQLGRRNLTRDQFALFLGKLYNTEKAAHGGDRKSKGQNGPLIGTTETTAEKLAREHGVSPRTVKRAGQFAEAVEKAKTANAEIERKVVKGEITRAEVVKASKPDDETATVSVDADGRPIPQHLDHAFEIAEQIKHIAREVTKLRSTIEQSAEAEPMAWSQIGTQDVVAKLKLVAEGLRLGCPHVVCSYCGGEDSEKCEGCKGTGFLSKTRARCVPKELRPVEEGDA